MGTEAQNLDSCRAGYTIFELVITVLLVGVVSTLAAPRLGEMFDSYDRRNAELQVIQDMRLAQKTAVEQGCQGILISGAGGNTYSFGCDYVPYSAATPPVYDGVLFTRNLPTDISIVLDSQVMFNTRGQTIDSNGALDTRTVQLRIHEPSGIRVFNTGTLSPTGFFQLAH